MFFKPIGSNKMAALASDWLRHFRLLLWNRWTACNETWQEERYQCPLPSLCFLGRSEKQDGRPGQSVNKVAYCTQVHDMWPFGPLVLKFAATCTTITRCTLECLSGPSVLWFFRFFSLLFSLLSFFPFLFVSFRFFSVSQFTGTHNLPACTSRLVVHYLYQVSYKSMQGCRRSWEDKLKCEKNSKCEGP